MQDSAQSKSLLKVLATDARSRPAWDEPPHLYLAYLSRGKARLESARIPDSAWGERPAHDLAALADAAASLCVIRVKPGLHAVAFRYEAYEFADAAPGTERFAQLARDSATGAAEARPDRREIRAVTAIDRTGLVYDVKLDRATGEMRKGVRQPDPASGHAGTIIGALDLLIAALLGVSPPERRRLPRERDGEVRG